MVNKSGNAKINGFTIVELLVVIVIIGILASITMVAYTGISQKAIAATLQSDLKNASTLLEMDKTIAGTYPATKEAANNGNGLNPSPGTDLTYTYISNTDNYTLVAGKGETSYFITSPGKTPTVGTILDATLIIDIEIAIGQIADDKATNGTYPATAGDANSGAGLQPSPGVTVTYTHDAPTDTYTLIASKDGTSYSITSEDTRPVVGTAPEIPVVNPFAIAWGGTDYDWGSSLVQTSDGGYAVTGETDSFGSVGGGMFIAKYDLNGNLSWNKTWGGSGYDEGDSLVQTSDGGYAVTGYTNSYAGSYDMFIAKYDLNGNLSWNKTWGGTGYDYGNSLVQTSDGGYAVTGETYSYGANYADSHMFLAKYDLNGDLSWNKTWGGTGYNKGRSLVQTSDGGYAVTGMTYSYGVGGSSDMFLAKYDSTGNLSWSKTWGGAGTRTEYGNSLVQTSDGGYAVTGETWSYGTSGEMFLTKYNSAGNLSWNKTWGGTGDDTGNSLVQTSDGGYAVTGYTNSYGAGGYDMFIAKYDTNGNLSWNKTWGGSNYDYSSSLVQTSDGGYAVIGITGGYGAGSGDMFLVKYDSTGNISGCTAPMCQVPSATVTSPTATVSSPTATVTSPTATVTSPTATVTSPAATTTVIVAP